MAAHPPVIARFRFPPNTQGFVSCVQFFLFHTYMFMPDMYFHSKFLYVRCYVILRVFMVKLACLRILARRG